jgi:arylsulfatase A-like enzyme
MLEHGGSQGKLREGKQYTFEGGQRVPTVAMWPKVIESGRVYGDMALMLDIFPTLSSIAGVPVPDSIILDGIDISNVLKGESKRKDSSYLYGYGDDWRAYREGKWKVKVAFEGFEGNWWKKGVDEHPILLINLENDPEEQTNLAEKYPEKTREMLVKMDSAVKALGKLPPSLKVREGADLSHIKYLTKKYGEKYWERN